MDLKKENRRTFLRAPYAILFEKIQDSRHLQESVISALLAVCYPRKFCLLPFIFRERVN